MRLNPGVWIVWKRQSVGQLARLRRMRFDRFFEMLEDKGLLAKQESGKGEECPVKLRDSSSAMSGSKTLASGTSDDGGGCSNDGGRCSRSNDGFLSVTSASRNAESSVPTVSVSKTRSGENTDDSDGGSNGGEASTKGVFGLFSNAGAPRNDRSSFSVGSGSKSDSGSNLGGGEGGSGGELYFSGGGGGLESGGSSMGGGIYVQTWEKPSLSIIKELNSEREAVKFKRSPKTLMLPAVPTVFGTKPCVLLRPLLDIVGARLQIGMVESFGRNMHWRECCRKKELVEDYWDGKTMEHDQTTQVAPTIVSTLPP